MMGEPILTETRHGATGPLVINGLEDLQARVGQDLGVSSWRTVEQADINTFAKLTGDEQWIHVDGDSHTIGHTKLVPGLMREMDYPDVAALAMPAALLFFRLRPRATLPLRERVPRAADRQDEPRA